MFILWIYELNKILIKKYRNAVFPCCKHQFGGLNVLYTSNRTIVRPDFSNVTLQSILNEAYIATPGQITLSLVKNRMEMTWSTIVLTDF